MAPFSHLVVTVGDFHHAGLLQLPAMLQVECYSVPASPVKAVQSFTVKQISPSVGLHLGVPKRDARFLRFHYVLLLFLLHWFELPERKLVSDTEQKVV